MKVKVFVHAKYGRHYDADTGRFCNGVEYLAWPMESEAWGVFFHEAEIDVPEVDENSLRDGQVKIMREEQQRIRAEAEVKYQNIEQQIQEMLCLSAPVEQEIA